MTARRSSQRLRTCLVLLTGCVLSLVSGCELGAEPRVDPPPVAVSDPASDRRALPRPQRLLDSGLDRLPRLRTRLPRSVPERADAFPSLLTNPPGRALLAYHPSEGFGFHGPEGWASETLLFFGSDRRWRSLRMDELGLPAEAWPFSDTYGAGELSPDGHWWAGRSSAGVVLLDLSTGQHRLVDTGTSWVSEIRWLSDSRAYVVSNGRIGPHGRAQRVTVPDLQVTELPYLLWQVGIAPDDTVYSLRRIRVGEAELVKHRGAELVPHGRLMLPGLGRGSPQLQGVTATEGRFAIWHQPHPRDFRRSELVVVDSTSMEVEARLVFDNRDGVVKFYSWLDPETMLLETADGIVAWRHGSARLLRVLDVPPAAANRYWSVELAGPVGVGGTTSSTPSPPAATAPALEFVGSSSPLLQDLWRPLESLPLLRTSLPQRLDFEEIRRSPPISQAPIGSAVLAVGVDPGAYRVGDPAVVTAGGQWRMVERDELGMRNPLGALDPSEGRMGFAAPAPGLRSAGATVPVTFPHWSRPA